jgi:hypothetical protein
VVRARSTSVSIASNAEAPWIDIVESEVGRPYDDVIAHSRQDRKGHWRRGRDGAIVE